jgi:hypothetical protein
MTPDEILRRAAEAFRADTEAPPPLTLRGGCAVDGYDEAEPFDDALDRPTDAYLEGHAFWGLGYLDARSWRHYLPRLIGYALRRPDDPSMVVEALVRSLRPPDRYPPRLATLDASQEAVIVAFLETLAVGDGARDEAREALEEWWLPGARHRPRADEIAALRAAPMRYRAVDREGYRLTLPMTLATSGARHIADESRTVEVWSGVLCGDVPAMVAVNQFWRVGRSLGEVVQRAATGLRAASVASRAVSVAGARSAERLDGLTRGHSPAEPERITIVAARDGEDAVLLTVRSWPRSDVEAALERIVAGFEIVARGGDASAEAR